MVVHTSGTTGAPKPVELTYGNWRGNALGSASRWASTRASAGCARCRCRTSAACVLLRSAIYGDDRGADDRLRRRRRRRAAARGDVDDRLARARRCSRGRSTPGWSARGAALRAARRRADAARAARARAGRRRPGRPDLRPDGGVLAGDDRRAGRPVDRRHAAARRPHRLAATARSWSTAHVAPRGHVLRTGRPRAPGRARPADVTGRKATRSSPAARTSRRPRSRPSCSRTPPSPRPPSTAGPTRSGARPWSPRSSCAPDASSTSDDLARTAAERLAALQGPQGVRVRRRAAADRLGQAAAPRAVGLRAMDDPDDFRASQPRALGGGGRGLGPARAGAARHACPSRRG